MNAGTLKTYVDGAPSTNIASSGIIAAITPPDANFIIGRNPTTGDFKGKISLMSIYNTVKSDADILDVYNNWQASI